MKFALDQSDDGTIKSARVRIPGCGNNHVVSGSSIALEIENGEIKLFVYGDINSKEPTHVIDMSGALEAKRRKAEDPKKEPGEAVEQEAQEHI